LNGSTLPATYGSWFDPALHHGSRAYLRVVFRVPCPTTDLLPVCAFCVCVGCTRSRSLRYLRTWVFTICLPIAIPATARLPTSYVWGYPHTYHYRICHHVEGIAFYLRLTYHAYYTLLLVAVFVDVPTLTTLPLIGSLWAFGRLRTVVRLILPVPPPPRSFYPPAVEIAAATFVYH